METFSPIDVVELLSNPLQVDIPKGRSKTWIWVVLIAIIVVIGIILLVTEQVPKKVAKKEHL